MKKILFLLATLMMFIVSCGGTPKEVTIPNKKVKYENGAVTYSGKPYTGKIKSNLRDKMEGYDGSISLKEGHLDGITEVASKKGETFKFAVKDGKFDGEMIVKENSQQVDGVITFENGIIKKMKMTMPGTDMDLTADADNKFNGTMSSGGQSFEFKDGVADYMGAKMSLSVNPETGGFEMEVTANGQTQKQSMGSMFPTVQQFEQMIFPSMVN